MFAVKKKKNTIRGGTGKNAGEAVKEKVSNVTASARAGLEKTKATLEEKVCTCHTQVTTLSTWKEHEFSLVWFI